MKINTWTSQLDIIEIFKSDNLIVDLFNYRSLLVKHRSVFSYLRLSILYSSKPPCSRELPYCPKNEPAWPLGLNLTWGHNYSWAERRYSNPQLVRCPNNTMYEWTILYKITCKTGPSTRKSSSPPSFQASWRWKVCSMYGRIWKALFLFFMTKGRWWILLVNVIFKCFNPIQCVSDSVIRTASENRTEEGSPRPTSYRFCGIEKVTWTSVIPPMKWRWCLIHKIVRVSMK